MVGWLTGWVSPCLGVSRHPKAGVGVWNEYDRTPCTFYKVTGSRPTKHCLGLTHYYVCSVRMNVKVEHDERIDVLALEFPSVLPVLRQIDLPQAAFIADPSSNYVSVAH